MISQPSLRKIVLHGYLKALYPGDIEIAADNMEELINGMCRQTKAFLPALGADRHTIRAVGFDTVESLIEPMKQDVVHLVPVFQGGKSGFWQIAIGVVLIAVAIWNPVGLGLAAAGSGALFTTSTVFFLGATMALGGILQLLSPSPSADLSPVAQDPEASKYLGSPGNTVRIGTRIPLLYGEHMAYGHYLKFDIDAVNV